MSYFAIRPMESGALDIDGLPGGLDLVHTLESGQSYLWRRLDGEGYGQGPAGAWYETAFGDTWVQVRQADGKLHWRSNGDAVPVLHRLLRLDDDLPAIYRSLPDDPLVAQSIETFRGMRLVSDPAFPCLISFICSAQMRVERIHRMQLGLMEHYGRTFEHDGREIHAFPSPTRLADATEAELRELGLGYRAPYVEATARMVADGDRPEPARSLSYEEAREALTRFVGVGQKVADCVLLFALDFLQAVPLDTWIRQAIESAYPDCERGSYADTSRAIREAFGGRHAGYAQTYVFHALRMNEVSVPA